MVVKRASDFETVVTGDKAQMQTEVWSTASVELNAPNEYDSVYVGHSIDDYFNNLFSYKCKVIDYFHNEKFDGSFMVDWLLRHGYHVAEDDDGLMVKTQYQMKNNEFTCLISDKGMWYSIKIKHNNIVYEIRDSLKLLPFTLKQIGTSFKTEHQKTEIEYIGNRYAGCPISPEEMEYIKNDVLVLKEALNIMEEEGHNKITIGSCCLNEYKKGYDNYEFMDMFPNLYTDFYALPMEYGSMTVGDYIRKAYKGGWCYLKDDRANTLFKADKFFNGKMIAGTTCDVNSLYPSMMHSESGNRYPVGEPHLFEKRIPKEIEDNPEYYYFVRVRTRFYLKPDHLPTIQIKGSPFYHPRKWLETSDYVDRDGKHYRSLVDDVTEGLTGGVLEMKPTLTLTCTDWKLMQEHYNLEETEILDGVYFETEIGIFDDYINKYAKIKMESKGAKRTLAKLFLNNLYGKMATSPDASYKMPYMREDGIVGFTTVQDESLKKAGYIPIGAAITSYAREFTIRAAQKNYNTFVYADTDSIHCLCTPDEIKGAPEDPVKFNHWKYEACWDEAIFVRAKTYIEHVTHDNREEIEEPYYNIKCAGMPQRANENLASKFKNEPLKKDATEWDVEQYEHKIGIHHLNKDEIAFHKLPKKPLTDFKFGLVVPGSLKPKRIKGGVVLISNDYVMRQTFW